MIGDSMNITLPTIEQLMGPNKLRILRKIGNQAKTSDLAKITGVDTRYQDLGWYWTKSAIPSGVPAIVDQNGDVGCYEPYYRHIGMRLVTSFSELQKNADKKIKRPDGLWEMECGETFLEAPSFMTQRKLENLYKKMVLPSIEETFPTDKREMDEFKLPYEQTDNTIYFLDRKMYVRLKAKTNDKKSKKLNKGLKCSPGDYVWLERKPIKWIASEEEDFAITEDILVGGVQFDSERNYHGNFEETDIYRYLQDFVKTMFIKLGEKNQIDDSQKTPKEEADNSFLNKIRLLAESLSELSPSVQETFRQELVVLATKYLDKMKEIDENTDADLGVRLFLAHSTEWLFEGEYNKIAKRIEMAKISKPLEEEYQKTIQSLYADTDEESAKKHI